MAPFTTLVLLLVVFLPSKISAEATNYTSIAIVGSVYCKCKFNGYDSNVGGTPEKGTNNDYDLMCVHFHLSLLNLHI